MQVSGGHGGLLPAVGLPEAPVGGRADAGGPEGGGLVPHCLGAGNLLGLP